MMTTLQYRHITRSAIRIRSISGPVDSTVTIWEYRLVSRASAKQAGYSVVFNFWEFLQMQDKSMIEKMVTQAQGALDRGDVTNALSVYAEICRLDPENPDAWFMFGAISGELGDAEVARSALERAITLDPQNAGAHLALAYHHKAQGRAHDAMKSAQQAAALDATFTDAWLCVAATAGLLGEWSLAETACTRAIALDPNRIEAHVNLGNVFLGTGRAIEAESAYRQALEIGDMAEAWFGLGTTLGALERDTEALTALEAACRMKPDDADMRAAHSACIARQGLTH
jgi:tetratricopeptide (TPR) repeat protein